MIAVAGITDTAEKLDRLGFLEKYAGSTPYKISSYSQRTFRKQRPILIKWSRGFMESLSLAKISFRYKLTKAGELFLSNSRTTRKD